MILLTTNQIHALECEDRFYNASDAIVNYDYLLRYRPYCDQVMVLLRSRTADQVDASLPRVDGENVTVMPLPDPGPLLKHSDTLPRLDGSAPTTAPAAEKAGGAE